MRALTFPAWRLIKKREAFTPCGRRTRAKSPNSTQPAIPLPFTAPALGGSNSLPLPVRVNQGESEIAVDNSATASQGRIYVASGGCSCVRTQWQPCRRKFSPWFGRSFGVAVESGTGDFWVAELFGSITQYTAEGVQTGASFHTTVNTFNGTHCQIAVDSTGNVYVAEYWGGTYEYSPSGSGQYTYQYTLDSGSSRSGLAIDSTTGNIYLAEVWAGC